MIKREKTRLRQTSRWVLKEITNDWTAKKKKPGKLRNFLKQKKEKKVNLLRISVSRDN